MKTILTVLFLALLATPSYAQGSFCEGFRDGWKAGFKAAHLVMPPPPPCPYTSGPRTYEAGMIEGVRAATLRGAR